MDIRHFQMDRCGESGILSAMTLSCFQHQGRPSFCLFVYAGSSIERKIRAVATDRRDIIGKSTKLPY
jgi:hypothetical protein